MSLILQVLTNFIKDTPTQVFSWKNFKNNFSAEHLQWLLLSKQTPTQVFTSEICNIFKNTFFTEHLRWLLLNGNFSVVRLRNNKNQHDVLWFPYSFPRTSCEEKAPSFWFWCNSILSFKTIPLLINQTYTDHSHLQWNKLLKKNISCKKEKQQLKKTS